MIVTQDQIADLKAYLGPDSASQWADVELGGVLGSEGAAQALRVTGDVGNPDTADLYEALLRRCARNLAMRKAPLGIAFSTDGVDVTRVGGTDPEVRRLEAPWRRRIVG